MFIQYAEHIYNLNKYQEILRHGKKIILWNNEDDNESLIFSTEEECISAFGGIICATKPLVIGKV